jgi:pimeloyl-ACP methyl ester carboxylesterase
VVAADGLSLACTSSGGQGVPTVAVHATGFCKELWEPVIRRARGRWRVVAPDQRGHGDSGTPLLPLDWWDLGRDLLAVVDQAALEGPVGLGHSSGATALAMAELLRPGTFRALVLVEPIVFPPPYFRAEANPMSAAALRRRASFPSPQAALAAFRGRGAFRHWTEEALTLYVAHGLRRHDGTWALKCTPEVEAEFYRGATAHGAWERLGEVACPVLLVGGADSDSHPAPFLDAIRRRFASARLEVVPGVGHFVPMEQPGAVAGLLDSLSPGD